MVFASFGDWYYWTQEAFSLALDQNVERGIQYIILSVFIPLYVNGLSTLDYGVTCFDYSITPYYLLYVKESIRYGTIIILWYHTISY